MAGYRTNYTMEEDNLILSIIVESKLYYAVRGKHIWLDIANIGCIDRTWGSLQTRFVKFILPNITNPCFDIPDIEKQKILLAWEQTKTEFDPEPLKKGEYSSDSEYSTVDGSDEEKEGSEEEIVDIDIQESDDSDVNIKNDETNIPNGEETDIENDEDNSKEIDIENVSEQETDIENFKNLEEDNSANGSSSENTGIEEINGSIDKQKMKMKEKVTENNNISEENSDIFKSEDLMKIVVLNDNFF